MFATSAFRRRSELRWPQHARRGHSARANAIGRRFGGRARVAALVLAVVLGVVFTSFGRDTRQCADQPFRGQPNSADRMVFWSGCPDLIDMKDAELERWHRRGVDGFACTIGHLFGLGGEHRFTGDLNAISGKSYNWERYLRISKIAGSARTSSA